MLFHTWIFAVFFAVALAGHLVCRRTPAASAWLLLASYVFYGWWNPLYLLLIAFSKSGSSSIGGTSSSGTGSAPESSSR